MKVTPQYLAGVVDSDGSISIVRRLRQTTSRGYQYREVIQITWVDTPESRAVFSALKLEYGGSIFSVSKRADRFANAKPTIKYSAEAKAVERILNDITPYLILKKQQALATLEMRKLKSNKYGVSYPKPNSVWKAEDMIYRTTLKHPARGMA